MSIKTLGLFLSIAFSMALLFTLLVAGDTGRAQAQTDPTPETMDECVETVSADGAISGSWSSDCASEGRSGSYAGYYTFTLAESADVTITAESSVDTYLFLRDGSERDGAELCSNDDHGSDVNGDLCQSIESTLGSEYDSGLAASLGAGSYIIEVTTYDAAETGEFTLTISGLPTDVSPTPTPTPQPSPTLGPSPSPTPTPDPTPEPADECVSAVSGNGAISGSWSSNCASEGRSGSYASYYTFTLAEAADVTITAESSVDTYLFLREGSGRDGTVVAENDDHDTSEFSLASNTDSGVSESLTVGTYTIEVSTYTAGETGDFTLTVSGLPAAVTPTPTPQPSPTPGPSPSPTPTPDPTPEPADECVSAVDGNVAISGSWSSDCASEGRSGSYASYYTFTLTESADVTITAESGVDTYLLLRDGSGRDGTVVAENDDHASEDDCAAALGSDADSCITESLDAGPYTIEATTYDAGTVGDFMLTVTGLPAVASPATDRAVLVALYNATDGDNWTDKENWLSDEPLREWQGITTDDEGRVTHLHLTENNLTGTIPTELSSLSSLRDLRLFDNQLTGSIPLELGNLSDLEQLSLGGNQLTGGIPSELGSLSKLQYLSLHNNALTGAIPTELGNLSNLKSLHLFNNSLTGNIPVELGNLTNLERMSLRDNALTGAIPAELGNLSNLQSLFLFHNSLTDPLPRSLMNLTALERFAFGGNDGLCAPTDDAFQAWLQGIENENIPDYLIGPNCDDIPTPEPADECVSVVSADGAISGSWDSACASEGRSGSYASYYTFTLAESADVTITAESSVDTYLLLREGSGRDGAELCSNDDYGSDVSGDQCQSIESTLESEYDSGLVASLDAGNYTIEVTTYDEGETGTFTLTVTGLPFVASPATDRAALVALYNATDGDNWTDKENWLSDEPLGEWRGVTTDDEGRVIELRLWENNMIGEIPTELGDLSELTTLGLQVNQLTGEIPPELGNLSNLRELYLWENELSGEIPSELGNLSSLTVLDLPGNELSGEIPAELGSLSNLTVLFLSRNQLRGEIPSELGNLSSLVELELYGNQLTGEIPSELGDLSNLTILSLSRNQLRGEIPTELSNLSSLVELYLYENQLRGEIPSELGDLSNLTVLELYENQLTGEIPSELGDLSNLTILSLVRNQLRGEIPSELGNLSNLTGLYLWGNELRGEIPAELGSLANLEELALGGNELDGEIPTELGSLSSLVKLYLEENQLRGGIPSELGDLASLTVLELPGNELSGEIPSELGDLSELTVLSLARNQLRGEIPTELGGLSSLVELYLYENQLSGEIPTELGSLANLEELALGDNELDGEIAPELGNLASLTELYLDDNKLSGEIPAELGSLSSLTVLNLGGNQLAGEIPLELGNLSSLERLYFHENQLSGEIPLELGNLSSLERLYLWENELSGEIPPELGNLANLIVLELPGNELSGEIPV